MRSWVWGGAWRGGSRRVSKILDLVSQRAAVTGEWYMPGHRLRGFLEGGGCGFWASPSSVSNGDATVPTTGIGAVKLEAMDNFFSLLPSPFSLVGNDDSGELRIDDESQPAS